MTYLLLFYIIHHSLKIEKKKLNLKYGFNIVIKLHKKLCNKIFRSIIVKREGVKHKMRGL